MDEAERAALRRGHRHLRSAYRELFSEVTAILAPHDPVGLVSTGAPENEYEPEVGTILPRLRAATGPADVQRVLAEEFERWFGPGDNPKRFTAAFAPAAEEIWASWCRFQATRR